MRLVLQVFRILIFKLVFFFCQVDTENVTDGDDRTDNADYA